MGWRAFLGFVVGAAGFGRGCGGWFGVCGLEELCGFEEVLSDGVGGALGVMVFEALDDGLVAVGEVSEVVGGQGGEVGAGVGFEECPLADEGWVGGCVDDEFVEVGVESGLCVSVFVCGACAHAVEEVVEPGEGGGVDSGGGFGGGEGFEGGTDGVGLEEFVD